MTDRQDTSGKERNGWLTALNKFSRTPLPEPTSDARAKRPPSRRHRKAVTTWQDEVVMKQIARIKLETGRRQDSLIAEGLAWVVARYGGKGGD